MNPDEFKVLLLTKTAEEIVDTYLLDDDPGPNVSQEALLFLEERTRMIFGLNRDQPLSTFVVGSAKLGFALLEKPARNGSGYKPPYRAYEPGVSDIDVAVVSPTLYGEIWKELAREGAKQQRFPWRAGDLGHYMLHGWIRPDKFPPAPPQRCLDWNGVVRYVGRSEHFKYKNLRCGIYHSRYFLKLYQQRGVLAAQQAESSI